METTKVPGTNKKHEVLLYAISTCVWCKRMKKLLQKNNIEYKYIDIDLCSEEDRQKIREDIQKRKGRLSYPTLIIDDTTLITGFKEPAVKEALEI
ncbi:MAG: glutaredoxin family protein [Candidatus Bathyarchaeota archaeon]|jgi:glutaredoxin